MDSSESPVHGQQEGAAYNGHFECVCYHPLFLFNQFGDCEAAKLRSGNVPSADDWQEVLDPVVERYLTAAVRLLFRADAAFAKPEIYDYLEARNIGYAISLRSNQVWAADITYIPMAQGFLYLVAIMDWHSRHVLAWKLSNTMDTGFCMAALEEALGKGRPEIFNTDQGAQFTSEAFTRMLQEQRVQVSMDGKGRYLDNIFVERLWRSIKYEEVYLKAYQTVAEARAGIDAYLEFYNQQRPHQALGYRTPAEVYQNGQEGKKVAAQEVGLPSGMVKPSVGVGDSLNLALGLS